MECDTVQLLRTYVFQPARSYLLQLRVKLARGEQLRQKLR